ncbi:hypothetical protein H696_01855 [Fonticula alba]|uniref:Cytochrome b561 domain-containing protein n=1 Tax=Fonticula alba TaxID=691883 RepID=A0A058Z9C0_FONAL|nr:hypothetical protein H696_01855 [Fonticula alba]KCV70909.1 hypothetical protein H696_01855 [Fonticula alba]|eukprot:XP_009494032.1 hypothetical protein H696_01855 [Fonticula alba]
MWWWFYFPALLSTLSLIISLPHAAGAPGRPLAHRVNAVSSQVLSGDTFDLDDGTLLFARVWIFVALFLSFAGLFGSAWIMIQRYFVPNKDGLLPLHKWPGVSLLVNTFLIFLSSMLMRFGRARRGSF